MLIYNVTSKVDHRVHAAWLKWMEVNFLPAQTATKTVQGYQLTRLLNVDDSQGPTYALLLSFGSRDDFKSYEAKYRAAFEKAVKEQWGDDVLSFASTLDVILKHPSNS